MFDMGKQYSRLKDIHLHYGEDSMRQWTPVTAPFRRILLLRMN